MAMILQLVVEDLEEGHPRVWNQWIWHTKARGRSSPI